MKTLLMALLLGTIVASAQTNEVFQELPEHALPVLQNWLHQNSEVVEVCIFREEWKAPSEDVPKGVLMRYATITRVHKGSVKVGDHAVLTTYIEFPVSEWKREAALRPSRASLVDGELMLVMFNSKITPRRNGYWDVGADISRFPLDDYFYRAFKVEKERDPKLIGVAN